MREIGIERTAAWDILFPQSEGARLKAAGEAMGARCAVSAQEAVAETDMIISAVTASLKNNYPGLDWPKITEYNLERMATHGERRAVEMEEAAATLHELGLDPLMVDATVKRQREMGAVGKDASVRASLNHGRAAMLEAISAVKENDKQK